MRFVLYNFINEILSSANKEKRWYKHFLQGPLAETAASCFGITPDINDQNSNVNGLVHQMNGVNHSSPHRSPNNTTSPRVRKYFLVFEIRHFLQGKAIISFIYFIVLPWTLAIIHNLN